MTDFYQQFQAYKHDYSVLHPPPVMRKLSFAEEVGLDAALSVIAVLAAILLSAIRTSTIFALTEALLLDDYSAFGAMVDGILPPLSAVSALVAFEGVLAVAGYVRARNSERQDIPPAVVWLALATIMVAGLRASLTLFDLPATNPVMRGVTALLAVLTAFAPPLIVHFGGHIVGAVHVRWRAVVRQERERYEADMAAWEDALSRSFAVVRRRTTNTTTNANTNTNREQVREREQYEHEREHEQRVHERHEHEREQYDEHEHEQRVREQYERRERVNGKFGTGNRKQMVRDVVSSFVRENSRWPSPTEAARLVAEQVGDGRDARHFKSLVFEVVREMQRNGGT